MSILKRAADTAYTFRFLRLLTMDWSKMKAYELGLINSDGTKLKKPTTPEEKSAYTFFHRLVFNIKRLLNVVPGGMAKKLASYASALYLLKAHTEHSESEILESLDLDVDFLEENLEAPLSKYSLLKNRRYQINKDIIVPVANDSIDLVAEKGSIVTIKKSLGEHFGVEIFEAIHNLSNQCIFISPYDISVDLFQEEFSVTTSDIALIPKPLKTDAGDKYQRFKVPTNVFTRFDRGRKKHQRWTTFLDLNDEAQSQICQFAKKYRKALIILQDESTGAMRAIRSTSTDGR